MRIRYYSHVGLSTGYGRAASELALALAAHQDIELELIQIHPTPLAGRLEKLGPLLRRASGMSMTGSEDTPWPSDCDLAIVHTLPRDCAKVLNLERIDSVPAVAYTTWEADGMPYQITSALGQAFRQIWWPGPMMGVSDSPADVRLSFDGRADAVAYVPHAFDPEIELPKRARTDDDRFTFYFIGTWDSPRKNIDGLIRAYCHVFNPQDDVELVLRTNARQADFMQILGSTGLEPHELPLIRTLPPIDDAAIWELHANADCYVTASRGEAWDLPCFEAMLSGRHIIYPMTGQSYLHGTTARAVRSYPAPAMRGARAKEVRPGEWAVLTTGATDLTIKQNWWEPNLCELAEAMLEAYHERRRSIRVDAARLAQYTHRAVAQRVHDLAKEILRG